MKDKRSKIRVIILGTVFIMTVKSISHKNRTVTGWVKMKSGKEKQVTVRAENAQSL